MFTLPASNPAPEPTALPTSSFLGREREVREITALLRQPDVRLVTLLGPGGVGKTRLALQIAGEFDRATPGHVARIFLAPIADPAQVLPAVARALGVSEQAHAPLAGLIVQEVRDREALLLIDNAEQVVDGFDFLPAVLAGCPGLTVLVTSRTILRFSMEHVVPIDPLPTMRGPDGSRSLASALFIERARAVRPQLDLTPAHLAAIDELCARLDGLPLAIELAAARSRFFEPPALLRRISDRLQLLTGGPRDAPERHRTLRALLTWSHDLLDAESRVLFRRLGVFVGDASLEAVDAVCNATGDLGDGTEELIGQLVDQSLLRLVAGPEGEPRVRMLQTIRDYAREQLAFSGEEETIRRAHATYFLEVTQAIPLRNWNTGTPEAEALTRRFVPDQQNFLSALALLFEDEDKTAAVKLVIGIAPFLLEMGHLMELTDWIARAEPYVSLVDLDLQIFFNLMGSVAWLELTDYAKACHYAEEDVRVALALGRPHQIAHARARLGTALQLLGETAAGSRLQEESIAMWRELDEPLQVAFVQANLAECYLDAGDYDRAAPLLPGAFAVIMDHAPVVGGLCASSMGLLAIHRGDFAAAAAFYEQSLEYHRQPPYRQPSSRADRLHRIAILAAEFGEPEIGAHLIGAGDGILQRMGIVRAWRTRPDYLDVTSRLREMLGPERYQAAWTAGSMLSTPQAIDEALAVTRLRATWQERHREPTTSPAAASGESDLLAELTPRERDVLRLIALGKTNEAIAEELFISPRTVTTHITRTYAKLEITNRAEAVAIALRAGLA